MTVEHKDIEALIRLFEKSDWDELRLEIDGLQLVLSNDPEAPSVRVSDPDARPAPAPRKEPKQPRAAAKPDGSGAANAVPDGLVTITAPNLGTFYRAPKPGAPPYIEVGQTVEEGTDVCLIEVMKLFTSVKAGVCGKVVEICVEDGEMVEFGAALFYVEGTGGAAG